MIPSLIRKPSLSGYIRITSQTAIKGYCVNFALFILSLSSAYAGDKLDEMGKETEFFGSQKMIKTYVEEASHRFLIPRSWIWAVMKVESAGDISALSKRGAMGLMQIMPETWQMLRHQYNLGSDPYAPRDNILAGAGYLRDLYQLYGDHGVFAAYNAGPGRYEDYLRGRRLLPAETIEYIAKVNRWTFSEAPPSDFNFKNDPSLASHTDLFIRASFVRSDDPDEHDKERSTRQEIDQKVVDVSAITPSSSGLFVKVAGRSHSIE